MEEKTAYERIRCTRRNNRLTTMDYIHSMITNFTELHGDRYFSDDHAIVGGIGKLNRRCVTVIGIEKGHSIEERMYRNFGCVLPEGYRKALRLMKQAEKFHRPVICFIDTQGASCGKGAEERGVGEAIARNLYEMSGLKTPIISIIIGEGGSGGALALAVADEVWMLENAYYSVIAPESCASILFKDPMRANEAAEYLKLTAKDLKSMNVIEKIVKEPENFEDALLKEQFIKELKNSLSLKLRELLKENEKDLLQKRYEKYRKVGYYQEFDLLKRLENYE